MKALVTGACGFAGSHLIEELARLQGAPVDGTHRSYHEPVPPVLRSLLRAHELDILDGVACLRVLREIRPTHLFHLAGPAHVGDSFGAAAETSSAIFLGTINLLDAAAHLPEPPRVLFVSSAEVYGQAGKHGEPLTEATPPLPDNPYGVAKLSTELYAQSLARAGRLPVVISRSFNHIGPRQSPRFATSSFARQIALAERGLGPAELHVGNLSAKRDFLDVRDVARGYVLLAEKGVPGEVYNLASGVAVRIADVLDRLVRRSRVPVAVVHDPALDRPVDIPTRRGDARKLGALGWSARYTLDQTLEDLLESWRESVV